MPIAYCLLSIAYCLLLVAEAFYIKSVVVRRTRAIPRLTEMAQVQVEELLMERYNAESPAQFVQTVHGKLYIGNR